MLSVGDEFGVGWRIPTMSARQVTRGIVAGCRILADLVDRQILGGHERDGFLIARRAVAQCAVARSLM